MKKKLELYEDLTFEQKAEYTWDIQDILLKDNGSFVFASIFIIIGGTLAFINRTYLGVAIYLLLMGVFVFVFTTISGAKDAKKLREEYTKIAIENIKGRKRK